MNNQPPMVQDQDYMRERSDMLLAAMGEPLTKEQIEAARAIKTMEYCVGCDTHIRPGESCLCQQRVEKRRQHFAEMRKIAMEGMRNASPNPLVDWCADSAKIGTQIRIRIPKDFTIKDGSDLGWAN